MKLDSLIVYDCTIIQYPNASFPIAAVSEDEAFRKLQSLFPENIIKRKDVIIKNAGSIFY